VIFAFRRNLVLAASAGTGKTHSLVGVLVHLLMGASELGLKGRLCPPVDPSRVVATTFSRKAAAEIRGRLSLELEKLAAGDPSSKYRESIHEACDAAGAKRFSPREMTSRARRAKQRLFAGEIGTLHSFATTLVKSYALELGLSPDFELESEDAARARSDEAIARGIAERAEIDPEGVRALVRSSGGVDTLLREIASALSRLEEFGRGPDALLIDDKDAETIDETLRELVDHAAYLVGDPKHGPSARALLEAYEQHADGSERLAWAARDFCALRKTKSEALQGFFDFRDSKLPSGENNGDRGYRLVKSWQLRHKFAPQARSLRDLLVACDQELQRTRRRAGALGFGDVLRASRDLLLHHPGIAAEVGAGIDALLVDEFQDTSRLQRELVQLLWERDPAARVPGTVPSLDRLRDAGLFVVGDRKQSIYGFRGADVSVFAELAVGLAGWRARTALAIDAELAYEPEAPRADLVPLRHNRRSFNELLTFANAFSRRRLVASGKHLFEVNYVPETEDLLPPPERVSSAEPEVRTLWLRPPLGTRGKTTRLTEAFVIAERVREMASQGGTPLRDMAVLSHTNEMLQATAYALAHEGIPYVVAGRGFFSAREVRDLLAMLRLIVRPRDRLALLEVLRGPWLGARDETLLALTDPGKGLSELDARWEDGVRRVLLPEDERPRVRALFDFVTLLRRNVDRIPPGRLLREAVRALELEEVLIQLPRGEQRVANVRKLLTLADRETSARALLVRLTRAAEGSADETEAATFSEEDEAVRLLTVHASKGLDFPIVFIPEVGADGRRVEAAAMLIEPPLGARAATLSVRIADQHGARFDPPAFTRAKEILRKRDRAEKARLAYVAVTRAAERMLFVGDRRRPKEMSDAFQASIACTLQDLADDPSLRPVFSVVEVPSPKRTGKAAPQASVAPTPQAKVPALLRPAWRSVTLSTTALQDYAHCARRFQLVHLLDLPEHDLPPFAVPTVERDPDVEAMGSADPRTEGTAMHRILERLNLASGDMVAELEPLLAREGIARSDARHGRILRTLTRFATSPYAVALSGARVSRERPFVLPVEEDGHTLALRGTIDLLVEWPDGNVDVIDYKRARGKNPASYAFQLDAYALAARMFFPEAKVIRTGIVFLGGDASEPRWSEPADPERTRKTLFRLASRLIESRQSETFPRVPIARCKELRCGYASLCHPAPRARQLGLFG
jgi:ATP-dependent helicase/nuclease subunit A